MKKIYFLLCAMVALGLGAQTTINYPQDPGHYTNFEDGGSTYDNGSGAMGMWANFNAKQVAAFRNFTVTGLPGGTPSTMAIGDSFTITVSATRAYGQIGIALLASPSATSGWLDRHNNYAVQVNLNGEASGSYMPWELVSQGGTIDASSINGSTSYADFKFKFTLTGATSMEVDMNDGTEVFNVTLDKPDITSFCVYLSDDWNGSANADVFWKQTTEYTYAMTLSNNTQELENNATIFPNPAHNSIKINTTINSLMIYDINGKLVKEFKGEFDVMSEFNLSNLDSGIYILNIINNNGNKQISKLVKY